MRASDRVIGEMIRKARDHKTLVLDLRGNGGGSVEALREPRQPLLRP